MGVPSGANSRPPCASKLCGPVPKYEFPEEGGFSGLISFSAHSLKRILRPWVLVYHVLGGTKRIQRLVKNLGLVLHRGLLRPRALICFLVFGTRVEALTLVCAYYVKNVKEYKCPRIEKKQASFTEVFLSASETS